MTWVHQRVVTLGDTTVCHSLGRALQSRPPHAVRSAPVCRGSEVIRRMEDTIRIMQDELDALLEEGFQLFTGHIQASDRANTLSFLKKHAAYQAWYVKALRVIRQLYPDLSEEFRAHYRAMFPLPRVAPYPAWYTKALRLMRTLTFRRSHDAADQEKA